jgi:hypothetical protein
MNLLYNLINLVLTEDQSDRPISDLEVEMSEATNMRVFSFAQDLIYDVTRCKVQILPGNMLFVCFCIASFVGGS